MKAHLGSYEITVTAGGKTMTTHTTLSKTTAPRQVILE
jgi:hypothetical protein